LARTVAMNMGVFPIVDGDVANCAGCGAIAPFSQL
jgi:hypothetical protein